MAGTDHIAVAEMAINLAIRMKSQMLEIMQNQALVIIMRLNKQLDKLDFMTAAKILFSETPRKKKFGLDFHPSAVYLLAQYARYEIRRMEAELEQKKQEEEEKKLKEMESEAEEEDKSDSGKELADMKVRLNKLEEAAKEIFVETKKRPAADPPERHEDAAKKDKHKDSSSNSPKAAVSPRHDRKTNAENG